MTDGRVYTPEDELDVLHEDLGRARRRLADLERAPYDHRTCDPIKHGDTLAAARQRVAKLERELAKSLEAQAQAEDPYRSDGWLTTGLEEWLGGRV